jgi:hypothetical protein
MQAVETDLDRGDEVLHEVCQSEFAPEKLR